MIPVAIYIFLSFYFGRKNPLFYLILPYALQQGQAAFIDQGFSIGGKAIFAVTGQVFVDMLFFITLFIAIIFIGARVPNKRYFGTQLILLYFFYLALITLVSFVTYSNTMEVALTSRQFFYIPLSFFLWISVFHVVTREQYEEFLKLFFYVTPISALLYILNSSGLVEIFDRELIYREVEGESTTFFRDFSTMPTQMIPVLVLSVLSLVTTTMRIPKWLLITNIIILPVAVLFTFTRSVLISTILTTLVALFLVSLSKQGRILRIASTFSIVCLLLFIPTFLISKAVFPEAVEYFSDRLGSMVAEKTEEENVDIRRQYLEKAIDITHESNELTGIGMNRSQYAVMNEVGAWVADSTLPFLLYHTGWIGILILYLILVYFILDSIVCYRRTNDWLVAFLCASMITPAVSSMVMGGGLHTGSVWSFATLALYATVRLNLWKRPHESAGNISS